MKKTLLLAAFILAAFACTPVQQDIPGGEQPEDETPAAPAVEAAPVAPVAEAPAEAAAETAFDPSKVRYGRRNVIKKAPELSEEA